MADIYDILEEENTRRLLQRRLVPWVELVEPILFELQRHTDPAVQEAAVELQRHVARLVTGKRDPSPRRQSPP